MPRYLITAGTFKRDDGTVAHTGEEIELEADVARMHADKVQLLDVATEPAAEPTAEPASQA